MKRLVAGLSVALFVAALFVAPGCESSSSDGESSGSLVGVWTFVDAFLGENNLISLASAIFGASGTGTIEFKSDNTFVISGSGSATGAGSVSESASGTYSTSGNKLTLTPASDAEVSVSLEVTYELDGDNLSLTVSSTEISRLLSLFSNQISQYQTLIDTYVTGRNLLIELERQSSGR